jgi:hypothetical protein
MVATSHLPLEDISKDELVVKDYSENEGILQELIRLKIVEAPKRFVRSGFVSLPICKLLINPN